MFKNSLIAAAVLALVSTAAIAQLNSGFPTKSASVAPVAPAPADAPAPSMAPAAAVAAPVQAAPATMAAPVAAPAQPEAAKPEAAKPEEPKGVNPFTGKSTGMEGRQRSLELAKMETALLEEQIKQAGLREDLRTLPTKKAVEEAQAVTARMKEEAVQRETKTPAPSSQAQASAQGAAQPAAAAQASGGAAKPSAVEKPKSTRPAKKKPAGDKPVEQAAAPVKPMAPAVEVTSVMTFGGVRSAVLDFDGNILTAKHGESTPLGMLEILDGQSVRLAGRIYRVHGSTLARVVVSDPKPVDPKAANSAGPIVASPVLTAPTMSAPPMASFPSSSGNGKGAAGTNPQLPPLQLPSGVTIIPPAGGR